MNADEFKSRTKAFAIRVIRLVEGLPKNQTAKMIGNQLLRCGTSVGANYRAAWRAKSPADDGPIDAVQIQVVNRSEQRLEQHELDEVFPLHCQFHATSLYVAEALLLKS